MKKLLFLLAMLSIININYAMENERKKIDEVRPPLSNMLHPVLRKYFEQLRSNPTPLEKEILTIHLHIDSGKRSKQHLCYFCTNNKLFGIPREYIKDGLLLGSKSYEQSNDLAKILIAYIENKKNERLYVLLDEHSKQVD